MPAVKVSFSPRKLRTEGGVVLDTTLAALEHGDPNRIRGALEALRVLRPRLEGLEGQTAPAVHAAFETLHSDLQIYARESAPEESFREGLRELVRRARIRIDDWWREHCDREGL